MKSDEEIFAEKEKELKKTKETMSELESKLSMANRCLEASLNKEKEQQELMLQLQLQVDRLLMSNQQNKAGNNDDSGVSKLGSPSSMASSSSSKLSSQGGSQQQNQHARGAGGAGGGHHHAPLPHGRAKTAPQGNNNLLAPLDEKNSASGQPGGDGQKNRRAAAYSSPAVFTMDKFMQNFRARSQLLTETLEVRTSLFFFDRFQPVNILISNLFCLSSNLGERLCPPTERADVAARRRLSRRRRHSW